jgi:hypothetical protein
MSKTVFVAAVLAAATLVAAGLVMFPSSVQEAQANNPCITNAELDCDLEGIGSLETDADTCSTTDPQNANAANVDCDFKWIGDLKINVHSNDILVDNFPLGELPLPIQ